MNDPLSTHSFPCTYLAVVSLDLDDDDDDIDHHASSPSRSLQDCGGPTRGDDSNAECQAGAIFHAEIEIAIDGTFVGKVRPDPRG